MIVHTYYDIRHQKGTQKIDFVRTTRQIVSSNCYALELAKKMNKQ